MMIPIRRRRELSKEELVSHLKSLLSGLESGEVPCVWKVEKSTGGSACATEKKHIQKSRQDAGATKCEGL